MFVIGNESAERPWRDLLREDGRRWSIAEERLVVHKLLRCALCFDLCFRLSFHERFRLGEEVGCQHPDDALSLLPLCVAEVRTYF